MSASVSVTVSVSVSASVSASASASASASEALGVHRSPSSYFSAFRRSRRFPLTSLEMA